ncbi:MAG: hypothetical protein KME29_04745 [Calothrix sp. FI2-JRJ7]|jgi:hypothetical protein|nr:hypothetical protein [Calothrix sp. FI2-JRJ7]
MNNTDYNNQGTLIIYMAKDEDEWLTIDGNLLANGRCTQILKESYDYRRIEKREVEIGERLLTGIRCKNGTRTIPTDWVVTSTETYAPSSDIPGFREVTIAYCERIPLSLEEFRSAIYDSEATEHYEA